MKITLEEKELEKIIRQAFVHGQGNAEMMESGLERDETEDYTSSVMGSLIREQYLMETIKGDEELGLYKK